VRRRQPPRGIAQDAEDLLPGPRTRPDPGAERLAVDVLHDDAEPPPVESGIEHGDDVGVADARQRPRLRKERPVLLDRSPVQDLESDRPIELGVVREVDHSHRAAPQSPPDLVTLEDDLARRIGRADRGRRRRRRPRADDLRERQPAGGAVGGVPLNGRPHVGRQPTGAVVGELVDGRTTHPLPTVDAVHHPVKPARLTARC